MNNRIISLFFVLLCMTTISIAQTSSVQLKIKEKSFFRSERVVQIELSNQNRQLPLTSSNVNSGQYYYFLVSSAGDWQIDADIVTESLTKIEIYQNERKMPLAWKGDLIVNGEKVSILLGFPKTVKLNQLFLFQCPIDEVISQVEFKVPQELWPGYTSITDITKQADAALSTKQFKPAIGFYEQILGNGSLQIFPQYDESKIRRTLCYDGLSNETLTSFQSAASNTQLDLKQRIAQIDSYKPIFKFILDSLPRAEWGIGSLDPTVTPILDKSRSALSHITNIHDSLQRVLDDQNVRWIIEGSANSKTGYLYINMIQTLASAFSALDFSDTTSTELKVKISDEETEKLKKFNIMESFDTFIRLCNERYQTHLPIFPIEFLPNLRKDTTSFSLPYYSMLKAVNDFYYANYSSAKEEIFRVYRTSYDVDFNNKFDAMRTVILNREQHISNETMKMFDEALQFEKAKDFQNAQDKYRQITLIAPDYAYAFFALGKFHARTSDPIRAIYAYQKAFQIDTLYLSAYRECCSLYLRQSNYKEIINVLTAAIAKGNDYWETNYSLGIAYLGDADPARAIQCFEHALAINHKSYKTNIQLGIAYQNVKNYQKAREYFNNAIGIDPAKQEAVDFLTKLNELQRTGK